MDKKLSSPSSMTTIISNFATKKTNLIDQNLLGTNNGNLRKDFLQKQQSIRKAFHQQKPQNSCKVLIESNMSNKIENDLSENKQKTIKDSESILSSAHIKVSHLNEF